MYANRFFKVIGVDEHDVDSDFRPEVEIRPFRTCEWKICNI